MGFNLKNRRYFGAKTKLLDNIENVINDNIKKDNLSLIDVFGGTGVVGGHFIQKDNFKSLLINDFLYSNYIVFKAFFESKDFDKEKLEKIVKHFNSKTDLQENYYGIEFGDRYFSKRDATLIGYIRDTIDILLEKEKINESERNILLASLLFSCDKIANTAGHYDGFRKGVKIEDKFIYSLIDPLNLENKNVKSTQKDANELAKLLVENKYHFDIAFLDPPYNSRQYSRYYHFQDTLIKGDKPELFGVARKPKESQKSAYCFKNASLAFKDLINNLSKTCDNIIVTYNNTVESASKPNTMSLDQIKEILSSYGELKTYEFDFKVYNSGKTDVENTFNNHKEIVLFLKVNLSKL